NLRGMATLATSNLAATGGPLSITMSGTLESLVVPGAAASIPALTSLAGGFESDTRYWLGERQRTQPFICHNIELHEHAQITLPPNFHVLDVPEPAQTQDRFIDFRSQYTFDPLTNIITVSRDGSTHFDSDVCSVDQFEKMRPAIEAVGRDVRAEVIVRSSIDGARVATSSPQTATAGE
ncbi:MAG TPA: hypothetical protein VEI25_07205, partial [Paraburkholderia sp.]|nr:hypothetical protein [Paraburkholderia sp.]